MQDITVLLFRIRILILAVLVAEGPAALRASDSESLWLPSLTLAMPEPCTHKQCPVLQRATGTSMDLKLSH